jgi:hypothetical protein
MQYHAVMEAVDTGGDQALGMSWQAAVAEKEAVESSNQGLLNKIKEVESDKLRLSSTITELNCKLQEVGAVISKL